MVLCDDCKRIIRKIGYRYGSDGDYGYKCYQCAAKQALENQQSSHGFPTRVNVQTDEIMKE